MTRPALLILIAGPSAAGKTHFSKELKTSLVQSGIAAVVIGSDDYYREHWTPNSIYGFDTVDAIDRDALIGDVQALLERRLKHRRRYDMSTRAVSWESLKTTCDVVLLEGAYGPQLLMNHLHPDLLIYVSAFLPIRVMRRLRRDVRERERSVPSVLRQMLLNMIPGERRYIHPLQRSADLVISDVPQGLLQAVQRIEVLIRQSQAPAP
ncbi:uridine kinase [Synechococcus sp. BIOS-E4-1]|uniref:uridine kinase family protein n=1 Tax=Synechococcus sp. BIOS-E4-1 TaxID=1400864 RepID=UPI001648AA09|nr:nucleoside kinase [Synechococcus sp. BIOS-E4-1]QNI54451.1 uridine kinase [Synechococcus sp. BIOS-E4-1]